MASAGVTGLSIINRPRSLSAKKLQQEDKLRGRPGYEHLNEQLHILIEADLPTSVVGLRLRQAQEIIEELVKPVSEDYIKRQQLRELAMLNSNFREESPDPSGSVSPFNTSGMKRPKTVAPGHMHMDISVVYYENETLGTLALLIPSTEPEKRRKKEKLAPLLTHLVGRHTELGAKSVVVPKVLQDQKQRFLLEL
ncbi:hypothetical protein CTI12_AA029360 [Artemisia annua]|uniref:Uncharacterized protein n=1 Tax=Artemisia annua TaxID=35608 RepID=A0A2U1QHF7_ARTAN|nr:hypothetical protein CTI12_AA029360 [Artemisia annua]